MWRYLVFIVVFVLAACVSDYNEETNTLTIKYHEGGDSDTHIRQYNELLANGTKVRIVGSCASACTFFISLPNACVAPNATLSFHGTSFSGTVEEAQRQYDEARARGEGLPWPKFKTRQDVLDYGDYVVSFTYKPKMRKAYMDEWRHVRGGLSFVTFTGQELHDKFPTEVKLCK